MTSAAISSTGVRQTQDLTIPSTQNTAPVLEFRCLYTHDLRRKQKRWQDGLLRFHTFNKRVMVYDVPRNYIGDTHWRDDGIVQDGDEFELDKGVLIQVGEATGSMEQDLTELLEKRRKPQETYSAQGGSSLVREPISATTTRSIMAQPSHLRPKSLNALLGSPRGPTGRASLPMKSPYEIRKEDQQSDWKDERATKRLRLESRLEQRVEQSTISNAKADLPSIPPVRQTIPAFRVLCSRIDEQGKARTVTTSEVTANRSSASKRFTGSEGQQSLVVKISPPRGPESTTGQSNKARTQIDVSLAETPAMQEAARASREVKKVSSTCQHSGAKTAQEDGSNSLSRRATPSRPNPVLEIIEIISETENSAAPKERMKLQMASRKPRRKLMYRDLLAPDLVPNRRSPSNGTTYIHKSREMSTALESASRSKEPSEFHQEEQEDLADWLNGCHGRKGFQNTESFASQEEASCVSAGNGRIKEHRVSRSGEVCPGQNVAGPPNCTREPQAPGNPDRAIPKASSTVHDTALTLSKMDEILFSRAQSKPSRSHAPEQTSVVSRPQNLPPSPIPATPPPTSFPPNPTPHQPSSSKDSVPSSLSFQSQTSVTPPKAPASVPAEPVKAPVTKLPSPNNKPFKPPKYRSSLKKAVSDTSSMRPPPPLVKERSAGQEVLGEEVRKQENQGGSAWGKEGWDLFGCGRDGVECTYEEFKRKEGLV